MNTVFTRTCICYNESTADGYEPDLLISYIQIEPHLSYINLWVNSICAQAYLFSESTHHNNTAGIDEEVARTTDQS